jgi:Ca-activated chloride channel family protein
LLDKDFRLLYTVGQDDVGLTALLHRPAADSDGHFLLLLSPRAEWGKDAAIGRDVVFVLDTSGSMAGEKLEQAQKALVLCLNSLTARDRFALINFATTVNHFQTGLVEAAKEQREKGVRWVRSLTATGGTAINDALLAALELRPRDDGRPFTIVFFTDGEPTVGEQNPTAIVSNVMAKNTANTRIFTFGVGDDVNATLLDQLAERTRAASTYVRPHEDIEVKTSGLWDKISRPVLVDLKLSASENVQLSEMYPTRLPDLFHGGQLLVLGRYSGSGRATITLEGSVGRDKRTFTYEVDFPAKTGEERAFVENLFARRKIGYLLDQIRANGEKTELVQEVITLAKRHGIATPYTSYLIVPDAPMRITGTGLPKPAKVTTPPANRPDVRLVIPPGAAGQIGQLGQIGPASNIGHVGQFGNFGQMSGQIGQLGQIGQIGQLGGIGGTGQFGQVGGQIGQIGQAGQLGQFGQIGQLGFNGSMAPGQYALDWARQVQTKPADSTKNRGQVEGERLKEGGHDLKVLAEAQLKQAAYDQARAALAQKQQIAVQTGSLGVDLSIHSNKLRDAQRLALSPLRRVAGRTCLEVGGVWIDEEFDAKMTTVVVKAMSNAYFDLLASHPELSEVFQLGNFLVWVTPSRTALVIDLGAGQETISAKEIERLFAVK